MSERKFSCDLRAYTGTGFCFYDMDYGYIKLYRKMLENPCLRGNPNRISVWIYLLLNATHREQQKWFGKSSILLKKGQLITGRVSIKRATGVNEKTVQRVLSVLVLEHLIEQQTSNKNRLITILNWDKYQGSEQQNEQQMSNKRATSEQQASTNKNVKNVKNDKKQFLATLRVAQDEVNSLIPLFQTINPSYNKFFSNKTERSAIERLLKNYGKERLVSLLESLPDILSRPYAPRITTPYQLEAKLGELKVFLSQEKNKSKKTWTIL